MLAGMPEEGGSQSGYSTLEDRDEVLFHHQCIAHNTSVIFRSSIVRRQRVHQTVEVENHDCDENVRGREETKKSG